MTFSPKIVGSSGGSICFDAPALAGSAVGYSSSNSLSSLSSSSHRPLQDSTATDASVHRRFIPYSIRSGAVSGVLGSSSANPNTIVSSTLPASARTRTSALIERLMQAKDQGERRHQRIRRFALRFGIPTGLIGLFMWLPYGRPKSTPIILRNIGASFVYFGGVASMLGVLPSDKRAVCCVACVQGFTFSCLITMNFILIFSSISIISSGDCMPFATSDVEGDCSMAVVSVSLLVFFIVLLVVAMTRLVYSSRRHTRMLLRRLWGVCSGVLIVNGVIRAFVVVLSVLHNAPSGELWHCIDLFVRCLDPLLSLLFGMFSLHPRFRTEIQAWLALRGEVSTVAAIAELVSGGAVPDIIAEAKETFRCVRADKLNKIDLADNKPNHTLCDLSHLVEFGHGDIFVSHSWHDDAGSKWEALESYRCEFKELNGREARLWIDKYCIEQADLVKSLRSLPVYLAGCRRLLVLVGATYLSRLWCLVEIFVFLEMGSSLDQVDIRILKTDDGKEVPWQGMLEKFSVINASASFVEDEERLRSVIEACSLGSDGFDRVVKEAFRRVRGTKASSRHVGGSISAVGTMASVTNSFTNCGRTRTLSLTSTSSAVSGGQTTSLRAASSRASDECLIAVVLPASSSVAQTGSIITEPSLASDARQTTPVSIAHRRQYCL